MVATMRMWPVGLGWTCLSIARRSWSSASSPPTPLPLRSRMLLFLVQHFHDIEAIVGWSSWLNNWTLQRKNVYYSYAQKQFGANVAAAFYILNLKGGFRLAGQSDWVRPNAKGKFSLDFVNFSDLPIEEVDANGTVISYMGLNNLVSQQKLRCLSLRGCPEVDDWFLSRLHIFRDSLEELDLSGCSRVSVGGLTALHHLRKLRRLNLSSLPRLQNPGLVRILLEEVLPHCHIMGVEYQEGLQSTGVETDLEVTTEASSDLQTGELSLINEQNSVTHR